MSKTKQLFGVVVLSLLVICVVVVVVILTQQTETSPTPTKTTWLTKLQSLLGHQPTQSPLTEKELKYQDKAIPVLKTDPVFKLALNADYIITQFP